MGAEAWLAAALGLPLLILAWIFHYSQSLASKVATGQATAPLRGRFWQLPLLGESIQFLISAPDDWMRPRMKRYGPIFRTHLFGTPAICVTNAEAVKFVLQSPKLFKTSYPEAAKQIFGKDSISQVDGQLHSIYRSLILAPLTPEPLRQLLVKVDNVVKSGLQAWGAEINVLEELCKITFQVMSLFTCDTLSPGAALTDELRPNVLLLEDGTITLPINLPGTGYHNAFQARKKVVAILNHIIDKRRADADKESAQQHSDLIDSFLRWEKDGQKLTNSQIIDTMVFVMLAGHDTTAITVTWAIRNLCSNPTVYQEIKAENDAVAKRRASVDDPITWEELQQLPQTLHLFQETLRIANPAPFTLRDATEDVLYNGMVIPKGWKLILWFRYSHLESTYFPDPYEFNPDRFKTLPKTNTYTPFGTGNRICPGMELAKQEALVFLHRFIVSFDFEPAGPIGQKIQWYPIPRPVDGMPIRVRKRSSSLSVHPTYSS